MPSYILAIDQGTSGTKTLVFDEQGQAFCKATEPLKTAYLDNGWVEQQPEEIISNVLASIEGCLQTFKAKGGNLSDIKAAGISNQRETFIVWDKEGTPLYNAVVWQCKRSVPICERLKREGLEESVRNKTGLIIDPYFSGSKLIWLYENVAAVKEAVDSGGAYFGTVDTWLLFKFTNGKQYYTDFTNASRTLLFNLSTLTWDKELLDSFGLSNINLPECKPSSYLFGETDFNRLFDAPVPITAMIGDSHAAAFGEGCYTPGTAKATLGTGCSILMNIGKEIPHSQNGMVTTICWSTEEQVQYALEGIIVTCGASIEWLKNELHLFSDSKDTEAMAVSVEDNNGVYLIPAFSGLGAPHWDMNRKGAIVGLSFGSSKHHIVRAALESIPYQIKDVVAAMEEDTKIPLQLLMVDGGITANRFLVRFLADLLQKPVVNIGIADVSALGAAYLAGLKAGIFHSIEGLKGLNAEKKVYQPADSPLMKKYYEGWKRAISGGN